MADEHITIANTAPPAEPVEVHNSPPTSLEPAPVEKKPTKKSHVFLAAALICAGGYGAYLHSSSGVPTKKKVDAPVSLQQVEAPNPPPAPVVINAPEPPKPEPAPPVSEPKPVDLENHPPAEPAPLPTPAPTPPATDPVPPVDPAPTPVPPVVTPPAPTPAPIVKRPRWCHHPVDRFFYDMDLAWHRMMYDMGFNVPLDALKNRCSKK